MSAYRDDLQAAHLKIAALEADLARLKGPPPRRPPPTSIPGPGRPIGREEPLYVLPVIVAVFLGFMAALVLASLGCATAELNTKRVLSTTVVAVNGAYELLTRFDKERCASLVEKAKAGKPDEADREFAEHKARVKIALQVLATVDDALRVSNAASRIYQAIAAKDWGHALQELLAIGLAVRDALKVFGIAVPL